METSVGASNSHEIYSRLVLDRADLNAVAIYECEATAGNPLNDASREVGASMLNNERLRRLFGVLVNGKFQ